MPDQFTLLLEWRRNEASGRALSKLPSDYFDSTTAYLVALRRSYESDLRENPSGRKGEISRQTYQRASQVARDILESRVQKVLAIAFQASIGGGRDLPNAVSEERVLFDRMLSSILEHRRSAAPYLDSSANPPAPASPAPAVSPLPASPPPAPPARPTAPTVASRAPVGNPMSYVRIVQDRAPIAVGGDTIDLRAEDIIALPPETAQILVRERVAEALSTTAVPPTT